MAEIDRMTVKKLIANLQKCSPKSIVEIKIADGKDTAFTRAEIKVEEKDGVTQIRGFIWSDDDEAFSPWSSE